MYFFFFLISAEACINSYAGALRGRSPDSMSGTGMSSIQVPSFFFFFFSLLSYALISLTLFLSPPLSLSLYLLFEFFFQLFSFITKIRAISIKSYTRSLNQGFTVIYRRLFHYVKYNYSFAHQFWTIILREKELLFFFSFIDDSGKSMQMASDLQSRNTRAKIGFKFNLFD